jgi:hypothetical protein
VRPVPYVYQDQPRAQPGQVFVAFSVLAFEAACTSTWGITFRPFPATVISLLSQPVIPVLLAFDSAPLHRTALCLFSHPNHLAQSMKDSPPGGAQEDHGADTDTTAQHGYGGHGQRGRGPAKQLSPLLPIPKNRSTGSLAEPRDNSRLRLSSDAGSSIVDYESMAR